MSYKKKGLWLILPGLTGFIFFYIAPFIYSFYFAAIDNTFNRNFVGFDNFVKVISNKYYRLALKNTFEFTGTAVPILVILSFVLAVLLASQHKVSEVFRTTFIIPILLPSAAVVTIWHALFNENSLIIKFFSSGLLNLGENAMYKIPVLVFFIWKNTGFNLILFLAGLMNIPKEIYEACDVEGANWFKKHIKNPFY